MIHDDKEMCDLSNRYFHSSFNLPAQEEDLPDINNMDFTGLEPGSESAEFARSTLRQRIEKTSQILGINFPVEDRKSVGKCLSSEVGDDLSTISGVSTSVASSHKEAKSISSGKKVSFPFLSLKCIV